MIASMLYHHYYYWDYFDSFIDSYLMHSIIYFHYIVIFIYFEKSLFPVHHQQHIHYWVLNDLSDLFIQFDFP